MDHADLLRRAGADDATLPELLAYDTPLLTSEAARAVAIPAGDEAHLTAWSAYLEEGRRAGLVAELSRRFPQLRFPVREGISATEAYRRATRQGLFPDEDDPEATGLPLGRPDLVTLTLHPSLAGRFPALVAGERADFETLVRAFSARNEPVPVPASMGACLVKGFNNWDRLNAWRRAWEADHPDGDWDATWPEVVARKELYEDRFVILSTGPYSGLPAAEAGFPEEEWSDLSLRIRRDHEATHYLTLRTAGTARNNLLDEVLADAAGLLRTFGRYDAALALRFFGLERFPAYREGARLENYRGKPPLSDAAFEVLKRLVHGAVTNLAALDAASPAGTRDGTALARRLLLLASCSLSDLAAPDFPFRAAALFPPAPAVLSLAVTPDLEGAAAAGEAFARFAEEQAVPAETIGGVRVVLDEVLSNIAKYASPAGDAPRVELEAALTEGILEIRVSDSGRPFDPLARAEPDVAAPLAERPVGGLGVLLVKRLTDAQSWERRGGRNVLRLRKRVGP